MQNTVESIGEIMTSGNFQKLYIDQLKDLYSAEKQLTEALPKMAKAASTPSLQQAFMMHLEETKEHVQRIEQIFTGLDGSPRGKKCKAMEGLIEEGAELLEEKDKWEPEVLDAGLIAAAQRVEHYEIAAYGTARTFAEQLGDAQAITLLQQTLDEEYAADEKLTKLAVGEVNKKAQV